MKIQKLFFYISLLFYLSIGQLYELDAMDKSATQWVYLNILNITNAVIFLFFFKDYHHSIKIVFFKKPYFIFFLFLVSLTISIIYAPNLSIAFIKLSEWLTIFISSLIIGTILKILRPSIKTISALIVVSLMADLYFTYQSYFQFIKYIDFSRDYSIYLKGVSGNKNITAASFVIRLPFIFYLLLSSKNNVIKAFAFISSMLVIYAIFLLTARASIISLFLMFIIVITYLLYKRKEFGIKKIIIQTFLIGLIFFIPVLISNFSNTSSISITERVASINTADDQSSQNRLTYYQDAINRFIENPIMGVGLGNWKIKSIDYVSKEMQSYIIPYHVHNDFLEIAAESGIVSLLLYILIFYFVLIRILRLVNSSKFNLEVPLFGVVLFMSGLGFFIDSMLNFPHARPLMMVMFGFIISLAYLDFNPINANNEK